MEKIAITYVQQDKLEKVLEEKIDRMLDHNKSKQELIAEIIYMFCEVDYFNS